MREQDNNHEDSTIISSNSINSMNRKSEESNMSSSNIMSVSNRVVSTNQTPNNTFELLRNSQNTFNIPNEELEYNTKYQYTRPSITFSGMRPHYVNEHEENQFDLPHGKSLNAKGLNKKVNRCSESGIDLSEDAIMLLNTEN